MDIIKLAFYKAQPGDFYGNAIANYTGFFNWIGSWFHPTPKYCHVEIGILVDGIYKWYSSASRNDDGTTGTRWIDEAVLFKNPDRWDVFQVQAVRPVSDMIDTCNKENGKAYDWAGIFGFMTLFGQVNDKNKWYCSEICHYVYFGKWMKRVSPIGFFEEIQKNIIK